MPQTFPLERLDLGLMFEAADGSLDLWSPERTDGIRAPALPLPTRR